MTARMTAQPRIVVIRPGALGDTLLTFPALLWLRRWAPDAHLTLIARRDTLSLALASALADAAWPYDLPDWSALFVEHPHTGRAADPDEPNGAHGVGVENALANELADMPTAPPLTPLAQSTLMSADLVVAWVADPSGVVARNLRMLGVRRAIVAPGRPGAMPTIPTIPTIPTTLAASASPSNEAPLMPTRHAATYLLDTLAPLAASASSRHAAASDAISQVAADVMASSNFYVEADPANDADMRRLLTLLPALTPSPADMSAAEDVWRALGTPRTSGADTPAIESARASSAADPARVIALAPGSGGAAKRWPPASFAALAGIVAQMGDIPLVIEGPQDAAVVAATLAAWRRDQGARAPLAVARGLSVGALAGLLPRCAAYVGNDSGVTHLAGLLGLPTVALFGPTDPAVWAPLGPAVWTLRAPADELARLTPAQVMAMLEQALGHPAAPGR